MIPGLYDSQHSMHKDVPEASYGMVRPPWLVIIQSHTDRSPSERGEIRGDAMEFQLVLVAVLAAVVSSLLTFFFLERRAHSRVGRAYNEADRIIEEAETRRREATLTAQDEALRLRTDLDRELGQRRKDIDRIENRIEQKEATLDRKADSLDEREEQIRRLEVQTRQDRDVWTHERQQREREIAALRLEAEQEIESARDEQRRTLERVSGLTADDARAELIHEIEDEARAFGARRMHEIEQEMLGEAERRSRKVLATTIQRIASDYVAETTVSVVPLPSDDMKGRIIGREGRNIRALEQATGVDLIIDDTPETIMVSGFDPVRREIARRTLAKLLQDGRIHPARIEEGGWQSPARARAGNARGGRADRL